MITLKWGKQGEDLQKIDIVTCTWAGTENQAARTLEFTIPWNPYDKNFKAPSIGLGDKVKLYDGKTLLFTGIVTSREKTAAVGTASYSAYDYMHYLLRSTVSRIFKKTTPKKATASLCKQVGIKTTQLQDPKVNIKSAVYKEKSIYDIIISLYRKAYSKNKVRYMPVMVGEKFSIIKKGTNSGVTLDQGVDITGASYHDTTDNMVNSVQIYKQNNKKDGKPITNASQIKKYGTYMQAYTKEKDMKKGAAKKEAKALLVGITKEASVEALGNVACVAGRSVQIKDKATGLTGKFYISSDSHSFQDGIHTMQLQLVWQNTMEEGAEQEESKKKKK